MDMPDYTPYFDPEDNWPKYAVGPRKHLHALGVMALNFSFYEAALVVIFEMYLPKSVAKFMFNSLHNQARAEAIRELIGTFEKETDVADHVDYLATHFSMCAQNRHTCLHARSATPFLFDKLHLEKEASNAPGRIITFQITLPDLRQMADDMSVGADYLLKIWRYWAAREQRAGRGQYFVNQGAPIATLPEKPPKPRIVSPHQPGADPEA